MEMIGSLVVALRVGVRYAKVLTPGSADPEIQFSQATASVTEGSSTGSSDIVLQKVYSGSVDATEKTITLALWLEY